MNEPVTVAAGAQAVVWSATPDPRTAKMQAVARTERDTEKLMIAFKATPFVMSEVTSADELAKITAQRERFRKNADWLQAHVSDVYRRHRGKHICVAGQELFVANTAPAALALARKAHPDDDGPLLRYIPREKMERIYAHSRAIDLMR